MMLISLGQGTYLVGPHRAVEAFVKMERDGQRFVERIKTILNPVWVRAALSKARQIR